MYFGYFWGRISSIFVKKSIIFLIKFGISCLTSLKRLRDGFKIAQDDFLEATLDQLEPKLSPSCLEMGSSWPQVASSWAQVGSKLAQVGPKISSRRLQEARLKGPGRVQGRSWSQEVLQEAPGVQKWLQEPSKWSRIESKKASNLTPKSIKTMTSQSLQKQLPSLATLS